MFSFHLVFLAILKSIHIKYLLLHVVGISVLVSLDSIIVCTNGSKYWRLQYRFGGKEKMLAFGVYPDVSLANAREKRDEARKLVANGVDPSEKRKEVKEEQQKEFNTFEKVARDWHSTNKKWSEGHSHRVLKSLEDNIFVAIGKRNIAELKTRDLLEPI